MKKTNRLFLIFLALATLSLVSCDEDDVVEILTGGGGNDDSTNANGLKEALKVGVDTAVSRLAIEDGYFRDQAVKILLPNEIESAVEQFKSTDISLFGSTYTGADLYGGLTIPNPIGGNPLFQTNGLQGKEDDLILGLNRAAETAATEAKPIFVDAITGMTITDAAEILFGGVDTAATNYLRVNTYDNLYTAFEPKIDAALGSVQIGGTSVASLYEDYVADYNGLLNTNVLGSTVGSLMNINTIAATDLSDHGTRKGLDGLFLKVSEEEKNIREDPIARVTALLQEVFSQLD